MESQNNTEKKGVVKNPLENNGDVVIKKGLFIEMDYTGRTVDGELFDTTIKSVADREHFHLKKSFEPIIIKVGAGHVVPGLDKRLEGLKLGNHKISIPAEEAFGKKSAKLLQLIPLKFFKRDNLQPVPGLEVSVDGQTGVVRSVSGGRVIVDFNHLLAGKDVEYEVIIKRIVSDKKEQLIALLKLMGLPFKSISVDSDNAEITLLQELPADLSGFLIDDLKGKTGLKSIKFINPDKSNNDKK